MNLSNNRPNKIFFLGIGGSGMSGLAEVLFNLGYKVSGSDIEKSSATKRLSSLGIDISIGHKGSNISNKDMIIKSSAINDSNPELVEFQGLSKNVI